MLQLIRRFETNNRSNSGPIIMALRHKITKRVLIISNSRCVIYAWLSNQMETGVSPKNGKQI